MRYLLAAEGVASCTGRRSARAAFPHLLCDLDRGTARRLHAHRARLPRPPVSAVYRAARRDAIPRGLFSLADHALSDYPRFPHFRDIGVAVAGVAQHLLAVLADLGAWRGGTFSWPRISIGLVTVM